MIPFFIALPHFHRQCEHVSAFFSASRQSFTWSFSVFVNGRLFGSNVFALSFCSLSSMRHSSRLLMQVEVKSLISSWKIVQWDLQMGWIIPNHWYHLNYFWIPVSIWITFFLLHHEIFNGWQKLNISLLFYSDIIQYFWLSLALLKDNPHCLKTCSWSLLCLHTIFIFVLLLFLLAMF